MNIYSLLKLNETERCEQTALAAARLRERQQAQDAREYLEDMLLELRDVAGKAHLKGVVKHIEAARSELHPPSRARSGTPKRQRKD